MSVGGELRLNRVAKFVAGPEGLEELLHTCLQRLEQPGTILRKYSTTRRQSCVALVQPVLDVFGICHLF